MKDEGCLASMLLKIKTGLEELLEQSPIDYKRTLVSVILSSLFIWGLEILNVMVVLPKLPRSAVGSYCITLFFTFPLLAGILSVAFYALKYSVSSMFSLFLGNLTIILIGLGLLLFKFEVLLFKFEDSIYFLMTSSIVGIFCASLGALSAYYFFKFKQKNEPKRRS
jgi:hypothetical protein